MIKTSFSLIWWCFVEIRIQLLWIGLPRGQSIFSAVVCGFNFSFYANSVVYTSSRSISKALFFKPNTRCRYILTMLPRYAIWWVARSFLSWLTFACSRARWFHTNLGWNSSSSSSCSPFRWHVLRGCIGTRRCAYPYSNFSYTVLANALSKAVMLCTFVIQVWHGSPHG